MILNWGKRWSQRHPVGSAIIQLAGGGSIIAISLSEHGPLAVLLLGCAMALVGLVRLIWLLKK
ncbi:MAG: hypothetical protein IJJ45_09025 [Clostridia bacterium]|nr:hypothetical protein [Clostridia bacterium]